MNRDREPLAGVPPALPEVSCGWLMCDADQVPRADDWLGPAERAQLAALRVERRRAAWRLGRWTAKRAVALIDGRGLPLDRIAIIATESGAPLALIDSTPARCALSISHAAGRSLCLIGPAGVALGCDLERVEPRSRAFVADYFTDAERAVVEQAAANQRACLATLIWSAKEAVLKALREGLRVDTREVNVTRTAAASIAGWGRLIITHADSGRCFDGWWQLEGDLIATVAADTRLAPPRPLLARG